MGGVMKVFLTGASGFVGRFLARRLIEDGHSVIAAVRPTSNRSLIPDDCGIVDVDLLSEADVSRHLSGVEVIFHVAGAVKARSGEDFDRVNAGATAAIVNAAKTQCSEALFILTSSQAAAGPLGTGPITSYGRSKLLGEQVVTGFPRHIIVRPPAAIGHGDKAMASFFLWARRGISAVVADGEIGFCIISVSDLADFMAGLVNCPEAEGKTLQPSYPELITWNRFHEAMEKAMGRKILKIHLPAIAVRGIGLLAEITASITGSCPMVEREKVRELTAPGWVNLQHEVERITGWKPKLSFDETIRRAVQPPQ